MTANGTSPVQRTNIDPEETMSTPMIRIEYIRTISGFTLLLVQIYFWQRCNE